MNIFFLLPFLKCFKRILLAKNFFKFHARVQKCHFVGLSKVGLSKVIFEIFDRLNAANIVKEQSNVKESDPTDFAIKNHATE